MTEANGKPTWPQMRAEIKGSEKNLKEFVDLKVKGLSHQMTIIGNEIKDIKGGLEKSCQKSTENTIEIESQSHRLKALEDGEHLDIERKKIRSKNIATWIGLVIAFITAAGALLATLFKGK